MTKSNRAGGIALICAGHGFVDFYNNFLPVLLPLLMTKLGVSLTMSGILVMVLSFSANFSQPILGYIFDKRNYGIILLFAVPITGLTACSLGYLNSLPPVFPILFFLGLAVAAMHPLGTSLATFLSSKSNLGRVMSYYVAGGNFGFALAPVVVMAFMENCGIENIFLLALPGIFLGFLYWKYGLYKLPTAGKSKSNTESSTVISSLLKNSSILKLNLAMGLRCWSYMAINTFLPILMISNGCSSIMSGFMLTVFLGGTVTGGLIGGELGDRLNHKKVLASSMALAIIPSLYFCYNANTELLSILALFLSGAFIQAGQPSSIVWTQRMMPHFKGVASGMMMGASFGMGAIGAAITAALGEQIGLLTAITISVCFSCMGFILVLATPYKEN